MDTASSVEPPVESTAPQTLTRDESYALGEQIAVQAAHLDAATHRLLADLRAFEHSGAWFHQGARTCAEWLSWRLGWDGNRAREHVRVAKRLGELPRIDDALRRGELSYCKVRAMTRVATPANEALLLEDARYSTGTQLELICRKYASVSRTLRPCVEDDAHRRRISRRDLEDGMVAISAVLHPEEAVAVWEALTKVARERARDAGRFCRVDALVHVASEVVRGDRPDRSPTEIVVTVAAEVLQGTTSEAAQLAVASDGTCVSAETARRLACDAGVVVIHENADGTPLSVGRKTRTIPSAIKRAMLRRDRTCRFPGCHNRTFVEGHHVEHWATGGETELSNVLCMCTFHHRFVHEYGYRVELDAAHHPRFFDPRGRELPAVPAPQAECGARSVDVLHTCNHALEITATTNAPGWDGEPVNYDWVVEDLCRADGLA